MPKSHPAPAIDIAAPGRHGTAAFERTRPHPDSPGGSNTCVYRSPALSFKVASDSLDRERARALARGVYREKGYRFPVCARDPLDEPGAFTLLAETFGGRASGTITLHFDTPHGLPCDEIFARALRPLRQRGRRMVEVTRFAIPPGTPRAREIRVMLINLIFIHAKRVRGFDDFVIEVNPRHVGFYRKLLEFEPLAGPLSCPRVGGAPAHLLRVDLDLYARHQAARTGREGAIDRKGSGRTLYDSFLPPDREQALRKALVEASCLSEPHLLS